MKSLNESEAVALSAPMPYALVTSLDKNGRPNAMGAAWVTRTSFEPFLMMVSVDHRRYSHECILSQKEFVINYPGEEIADAAWTCGVISGRDLDKIKKAGLELVDSRVVKVPTVKWAAAAFECRLVDQFETGDHTVFVGEVVAISGNPDLPKHLYVSSKHKIFGMDGDGRSSLR
jgi:flavin reductase (DIM6/NTAB) family NADH-FMN oxidoreductase RutF